MERRPVVTGIAQSGTAFNRKTRRIASNAFSCVGNRITLKRLQPVTVLPGHGDVASSAAVERDLAFLGRAWAVVRQGLQRQTPLGELQSALQQTLGPMYREQYVDFDASVNYLVEMMYHKPAV
ncbi:hypothetical protein LJ739_12345 [Aestuariibacter halophilus]|uniref:Metallo-beta-lactamase domain-containing protein n=1 Tax=Fluctibacter halophilus TaxID=226011 RepID=A0ABS8G934_9ALTE|nr:hypothetical protein [Aestuariibacter halophilus]MCC2617033.1 hypothetical protein [Aestuariibacter halophilus]